MGWSWCWSVWWSKNRATVCAWQIGWSWDLQLVISILQKPHSTHTHTHTPKRKALSHQYRIFANSKWHKWQTNVNTTIQVIVCMLLSHPPKDCFVLHLLSSFRLFTQETTDAVLFVHRLLCDKSEVGKVPHRLCLESFLWMIICCLMLISQRANLYV